MFRIDAFLQEMLEKVAKADLLLSKESIRKEHPKKENKHIL